MEEITRRVDHASNPAALCAARLKTSHSRCCRWSETALMGGLYAGTIGAGSMATREAGSAAGAAGAEFTGARGSATSRPGAKLTEATSASADRASALRSSMEEAALSVLGIAASSAARETAGGSLAFVTLGTVCVEKTGNPNNSPAMASNIQPPQYGGAFREDRGRAAREGG